MDDEARERRRQFRQMAKEASCPATSPDELCRLSAFATDACATWGEHLVQPVAEALAAHPNAPPNILRWWLHIAPYAFLRNPVLPLLLLELPNFFDGVRAEKLLSLLSGAAVPPSVVRVLMASRHEAVARTACQHIVVAGEVDGDWEKEVIEQIKIMPAWRTDGRYEFALLGLFPDWLSEQAHAQYGAWKSEKRPIGVQKLTPPRSLSNIIPLEKPPGGWESLLRQSGAQRAECAGNPALPPEALLLLAADEEHHVRMAVAKNPASTAEVLACLAEQRRGEVWCHVAIHPNANTKTLFRICSADRWLSNKTAWYVLQRPDVPRRVLITLAKHFNPVIRLTLYHRFSATVEERVSLPSRGLFEIQRKAALQQGERHTDPVIAYFTLVHCDPSSALLAENARSPEWLRRLAVARHPNTSPKLRQRLAEQDGDRYVRAAARAFGALP